MKNARKETHHMIKIWKNAICMLMAVAMIVAYIPNDTFGIQNISKVEAAVSYNADSAASYALTYTDATGGYGTGNYNKAYSNFDGHDCANFVSQCLVAGGLATDGTWYPYSRAWIRADYLLEWFKANPEFSGHIVRNPSASEVKKGDPLFYVWGTEVAGAVPNDVDHAGICTGTDGNGNPLVSAHTKNRRNYSAWRMGAGAVYVVKLHEVSLNQTPDSSDWYESMSSIDTGTGFYGNLIKNDGWATVGATVDNNVEIVSEYAGSYAVWYFERQSDGSYVIRNCSDLNKVLSVEASSTERGANVHLSDYRNADNQKWYIYGRWSGEYYIRPKNSDKVLDVKSGSNTVGTNVEIWTKNETSAQQFAIYKVPSAQSSNISVSAGDSKTNTTFSWNKADNSNIYSLRIFTGSVSNLQEYKSFYNLRGLSYNIILPEGYYEAYVDYCNDYSFIRSINTVKFYVSKHVHSYYINGKIQAICQTCGEKNPAYKGSDSGSASIPTHLPTIDVKKTFHVTLSASRYIFNGKKKTPTVVVENGNGTVLRKNKDYTVSYSMGRKNIGIYKVKVIGKGSYAGTIIKTFIISPKCTNISVRGVKEGLWISGKTVKGVSGYQVQYAYNKKFTSHKKIITHKKNIFKISQLKSKKTYYVRMRTYKVVKDKKVYSSWSKIKQVKTK